MTAHQQTGSKPKPDRRAMLKALLEKRRQTGRSDDRIPRRKSTGPAPLSFAQERLWFLEQYHPGSALYTIPTAFALPGPIDVERARKALDTIVQRHEALRTTFHIIDGKPRQVVSPELTLELPVHDFSSGNADQMTAFQQLVAQESTRPFDLEEGPLIRVHLMKMPNGGGFVYVFMHHIISDGWSVAILTGEFSKLYQRSEDLPPLDIQYSDYAEWQRRQLEGDVLTKQLEFWRKHLEGAPTVIELPTDRRRPAHASYRGCGVSFKLPMSVSQRVTSLARKLNVTSFMLLLAAFKVLLFRYAGHSSIVVGVPVANRSRTELEGLIGFFVNSLVLHSRLDANQSFETVVARTRELTVAAYANQDLPFEKLVEDLQPERNLSTNPLFQVMFDYHSDPTEGSGGEGSGSGDPEELEITPNPGTGTSKFDLTMSMTTQGGRISGGLEYSTDLFDHETAFRIVGHLNTLLGAASAEPSRPIGRLPLMPEDEASRVLEEWNDTAETFPVFESVLDLFAERVAEQPDAIAAVYRGKELTYRGLDDRANRVANHLRSLGVRDEDVVGINMHRSLGMVVSVLGVLKAGGAYLPLDPTYPTERIAFMLDDAQVRVVLTGQSQETEFPTSLTILRVPEDDGFFGTDEVNPPLVAEPPLTTRPENACYMIYTSGSTGRPKGVVVSHRALLNLVHSLYKVVGVGPGNRVLQFASFSFDQSVRELFETLMLGGTLCLYDLDDIMPGEPLTRSLREGHITHVTLTPPVLGHLPQGDLPELNTVSSGGDVCTAALVQRVAPGRRMFNAYGPTESTFASSFKQCEPDGLDRNPSIGAPLPNVRYYVVDEQLEPCVVGRPGELLIGGTQLARGYFRRPQLTAERFIPDFLSGRAGERLYRTGDLVRWLPNGELDFLGRMDKQVKVQGFRIELGEVETVLKQAPNVDNVTVRCRTTKLGTKQLVAYVVASTGRSATTLRRFAGRILPEYMIPAVFIFLDELPLTANGKIDDAALPTPERAMREESYVAPRSAVEGVIASVWSAVLEIERVGVHENFFELGGHSLLATQIVSRIRDRLLAEMSVRLVFEAPTVAELAAALLADAEDPERLEDIAILSRDLDGLDDSELQSLLEEAEGKAAGESRGTASAPSADSERIPRRDPTRPAPLSFAQERLWFLDRFQPGNTAYNIFMPFPMAGTVNVPALQRALDELIKRHEILRTTFPMGDGQPTQSIASERRIELKVHDLSHISSDVEQKARVNEFIREEVVRPYDLEKGPLLRTQLMKLSHEHSLFALAIHHIISDGGSPRIIFRDLMAFYNAFRANTEPHLPVLDVQYADYAAWQRERLQGSKLGEGLSFWRDYLRDAPTVLQLPTDHPRPPTDSFRSRMLTFVVADDVYGSLKDLDARENTTLFMSCFAAFTALLFRYTGEPVMLVGSPIDNRSRAELEDLIGFFTNTVVLKGDLRGDPTFRTLMNRVREDTVNAYTHADLPFERLVEAINPVRVLNVNPLFQVMFILQKQLSGFDASEEEDAEDDPSEANFAKFDLTLYLEEKDERLVGGLEYATELFDADSVRQMIANFKTFLGAAVRSPDTPLSQLDLLPETERDRIIDEWSASPTQPRAHTVHELIARQIERCPERPAIVSQGRTMSFRELGGCADRLAQRLSEQGVSRGSSVAVLMGATMVRLVSMLALTQLGAAYVPVSTSAPEARVAPLLASCSLVLVETDTAHLVPEGVGSLDVSDAADPLVPGRDARRGRPVKSHAGQADVAYVIHTSGSTGTPRAVAVTNQTLSGLMQWQAERSTLGEDARTLQYSSTSFDVSVQEVFCTWGSGGTLVLASEEARRDPRVLLELLVAENIQRLFLPFVALRQLAEVAASHELVAGLRLREVITAGERLIVTPALRSLFTRLEGCSLFNQYGPSETHVVTEERLLGSPDTWPELPPIGRPVAGATIYLLDEHMRPCPVGVRGELYVGGGVEARGYLGDPRRTAESFVPDPFSSEPGARLYRTGDIARHRRDGTIDFLGRADDQLKIRGFRVEPGEVESALLKLPGVTACAVVGRSRSNGETDLVAYVTPANDVTLAPQELRSVLAEVLPGYMVPTQFAIATNWPVTETGKLDRRKLPALALTRELDRPLVEPRTPLETRLAAIWCEILDVPEVGIEDSFFDLGGHSLMATRLMSRISEEYGVEVPLRSLFEAPTIAALSVAIVERQAASLDDSEVAHLLDDIENLSDDEIEQLTR